MDRQKNLLSDIWDYFPELVSPDDDVMETRSFKDFVSEIFTIGRSYYYVINIFDNSLQNVSEKITTTHSLEKLPTNLQEIINLIHPEDLPFVLEAEKTILYKMREIGFEHHLNLKNSYCFRMKVSESCYRLFHHQSIHLSKNRHGELVHSLNIHTDISHITETNNRIVLINGFGEREDYIQIDLSVKNNIENNPKLSKREMEILPLIANGFSSQKIGEQLFISKQTVQVHRKHLLNKTNSPNTSALIKKCLELGLL